MSLNALADYVFIGVAATVPVALYYLRCIAINTYKPRKTRFDMFERYWRHRP